MSDPEHRTNRGGFIKVRDGLKLHVGHWPAPQSSARPILCLPGLTRNGRDFTEIAAALSSGTEPREVFTLDARGRGLSDHDPDWRNYSIPTETQDVIDVMIALDLHDAAILATVAALAAKGTRPAVRINNNVTIGRSFTDHMRISRRLSSSEA